MFSTNRTLGLLNSRIHTNCKSYNTLEEVVLQVDPLNGIETECMCFFYTFPNLAIKALKVSRILLKEKFFKTQLFLIFILKDFFYKT